MLAIPRTDPYVKNYLIRLLPRVDRENVLPDKGGVSLGEGGACEDAAEVVTMSKTSVGYDGVFAATTVLRFRPRTVADVGGFQGPRNS